MITKYTQKIEVKDKNTELIDEKKVCKEKRKLQN